MFHTISLKNPISSSSPILILLLPSPSPIPPIPIPLCHPFPIPYAKNPIKYLTRNNIKSIYNNKKVNL